MVRGVFKSQKENRVILTRFDPFANLDQISGELRGALSRRASSMPIDAYRHDDNWVVRIDLPGVEPGSIDLTVDRKVLRIEANHNWQPAEGDLVLVAERPRGTFSRQLILSEDIDSGAIQADYRDGVLTVVLPVSEVAMPRKVAIATSGPSAPSTVEAQAAEHPLAAERPQAA